MMTSGHVARLSSWRTYLTRDCGRGSEGSFEDKFVIMSRFWVLDGLRVKNLQQAFGSQVFESWHDHSPYPVHQSTTESA